MLDADDFYIDLLFFHRRMRRLVVIELKIDDFKPAYSERETVQYLDLDARGIHVAEYVTESPSREVLQDRLHRDRFESPARTNDRDGYSDEDFERSGR